MNKTALGTVLLVVGVIILVAVYSMRPPSGLGDAFMMMGQGRQHFIKEPLYQIFLSIGGIVSVFGTIQIFLGLQAKKNTD